MSPDSQAPFWTFDLARLRSLPAIVLSAIASLTLFAARLEGPEYRLQALDRPEIGGATTPGRATVPQTRLDAVPARLARLTMTSIRTRDTVQAIPGDIAVLKAARGN